MASFSWETVITGLTETVTGIHDVYMLFHGPVNNVDLYDFDWWMFGTEEAPVHIGSENKQGAGTGEAADGGTIDGGSGSDGDGSDIDNMPVPEFPEEGMLDTRSNSWFIWLMAGALIITGGVFAFMFIKKRR